MRFVTVCALLVPVVAAAAEPWDQGPLAADPSAIMRAAKAAPAVGDDVLVLFENDIYSYSADGRVDSRFYRVFRVLTATGAREWDSLETGWAPWHEERPQIRARVIGEDGSVRALDAATIDEAPAADSGPGMYSDRRLLRAPLPGVTVGAVIEEVIDFREKAPLFDAGVVERLSLAQSAPVRRTRIVVEAPPSLPLKQVVRLANEKPQRTTVGDRVRWVLERGPQPGLPPPEPNAPSDRPQWPYLAFSTGKSWEEVAARYARTVDAQIDNAKIAAYARDAAGGATERAEVAWKLLARVHRDVRYTGVELGEASIVPRSPTETLARKYGDCKDQATLLVAMLRAVGVPANVALLRAGPGLDVEPELPGLGAFTHAIVVLPGSPALWIDPTDEYARMGELPSPDRGRLALIAAAGTRALLRTPEERAADNRVVETREFTLAEKGAARIVEITDAAGAPERDYRHEYATNDRKKLEEGLDAYVKQEYLAKSLATFEHTDPNDLSRAFRLRLEAANAKRGTSELEDAAVALFPYGLTRRLPSELTDEKAKPRTIDYVLAEPYLYEWRYRIVPAPGFRPKPLPPSQTTTVGPMRLTETYAADGDVVTAHLVFDCGRARLTPAEVEAVRAAVKKLADAPPVLVTFEQVGQAHLDAGRIKEALDEFRRLAALHPTEALHHAQIAHALLAGGMGEAARAEARRAITIEPGSALAHRTLGWVLQHDLIGRRFGKGFDFAGAEAAYRKARTLSPSDADVRGDLAILYEHDPDGERYSPRARLGDAINEYRALEKDLGEKSLGENLLFALFWARRFGELQQAARPMPSSSARDQLLVAAAAAEGGVDAALREAATLTDSERRRSAVEAAAGQLLRLRMYPAGVALLGEAAKGAANPAQIRAQADALRATKRWDELPLSDRDPAGVVRRFLAGMMTMRDAQLPELRTMFAKGTILNGGSDSAIKEAFHNARGALRRSGMSPDVVADTALGVSDLVKDGDDALGWRVRVHARSGGTDEDYFLVRENGRLRILATAPTLSDVGPEVLRRLDAGDTAGARRWLDWARDEVDNDASPFSLMWQRDHVADRDSMRWAASALMAEGPMAARGLPALAECADRAAPDTQRICRLAQVLAWSTLKKPTEALKLVEKWDDAPFALKLSLLWRAGRIGEARALAEARLTARPDDPLALRSMADLAASSSDWEQALARLRKLVDSGHAEAGDYNQIAWYALCAGRAGDEAIEWAKKAVSLRNRTDAPSLHTLASLYAETGKPADAREILLESMQAAGAAEPQPDDWYVLGRIAEQYGARDVAAGYYARLTKPKEEDRVAPSCWALAQRRLKTR
jgi:Tfp pilus assembly protein PilF